MQVTRNLKPNRIFVRNVVMQRIQLNDIYTDILVLIAKHLHDHDILTWSQVNKRFANLFFANIIWTPRLQQRYQLPAGDAPSSKKLYFSLQKEEALAMDLWVAQRLFLKSIRVDNLKKNTRLIIDLTNNASLENNQLCASLLREEAAGYYAAAYKILNYIYKMPSGFINQTNMNEISYIYHKLTHCRLNNTEVSLDIIAEFKKLFPNIQEQSPKKFLSDFLLMLMMLPSAGCVNIIKHLILKHPQIPCIVFNDYDLISWLQHAIKKQQHEATKALIKAGSDVNLRLDQRGKLHNSPLFLALCNLAEIKTLSLAKPTIAVIEMLLEYGADLDAYNTDPRIQNRQLTSRHFCYEQLKHNRNFDKYFELAPLLKEKIGNRGVSPSSTRCMVM